MPEPGPRPIRLRECVEPFAGFKVCNFMIVRFSDYLINDRDKVVDLANHAADAGIVFFLNDAVHLGQTKRVERALLIDGSMNTASRLLNLYCCHILSSEYFFKRHSALLSDHAGITHFT